jgi:hypothetical protein
MEDVLDVYQRPLDDKRPVVCLDESTKQLIKETRIPIAAKTGSVEKYDHEYERNGVSTLFMMVSPLLGWRHVEVTERRTKLDFARCIKSLVDERFRDAEKIVLVMDNLNTHKPASLYEAFEPNEAKRLLNKLEIHYTPKHGSWLDIAEIEFNVLKKQCLNRRMSDEKFLKSEITAWEIARNNISGKIDWQFTTKDARVKLKRLYPSIREW